MPASPPGCEVEVDGVGLGVAPLWVRVAPGKRAVSLGAGCPTERQEQELASNREWTITWGTPHAARSATPVAPPSASSSSDAASLLREAQAMRAAGRLGEARRLYQEITSRHPSSAEAKTVRISLGQLELAAGRAERALASFDAYLATGGALAQEAHLGRIAALRALGRSRDELAAIDAFLAAYPGSLHAEGLRGRRAEIATP
jgi:tetratricopeptide (TPR) repeat protein